MFKQLKNGARKESSQRRHSDARFVPYRDQAAAALKDDKLTLSGNGMSLEWLRKPLVCHAQQCTVSN